MSAFKESRSLAQHDSLFDSLGPEVLYAAEKDEDRVEDGECPAPASCSCLCWRSGPASQAAQIEIEKIMDKMIDAECHNKLTLKSIITRDPSPQFTQIEVRKHWAKWSRQDTMINWPSSASSRGTPDPWQCHICQACNCCCKSLVICATEGSRQIQQRPQTFQAICFVFRHVLGGYRGKVWADERSRSNDGNQRPAYY